MGERLDELLFNHFKIYEYFRINSIKSKTIKTIQ